MKKSHNRLSFQPLNCLEASLGAPATSGSKNPSCPQGLASQPTLSRFVHAVARPDNLPTLHDGLVTAAARRIRSTNGGRRVATLAVDSLPNPVHGNQPGSMDNGHYHDRIYHPLIATAGELGDLLGGKLRCGNVQTADGAEAFVLGMLDQVEAKICVKAHLVQDAGFPSEPLLAALEARRTCYTCRIRKNAVLDRMAQPLQPVGRLPVLRRRDRQTGALPLGR